MDIGFFRLAKKASFSSDHRCRIGAVLVDKRPFISGYNKIKSHTKYAIPGVDLKVSIHAEIACLIGTKKDVSGCSIYVYREDANGEIANSRPCEDCLEELKKAGIRKIFYTTRELPNFRQESI